MAIRTILVATDLKIAGANALRRACLIAAGHGAAIALLHVVPRVMPPRSRAIAAEELAALCETQATRHPEVQAIAPRLAIGRPAEVIAAIAAEIDAWMIVVGAHGTGRWADDLFGTAIERLVRRVATPILVVHQRADRPYRRVIAAIDPGPLAAQTLELAATIASTREAYAVHAFMPTLRQLTATHGDSTLLRAADQHALDASVRDVLHRRPDIALNVHTISYRGGPVDVIVRAWRELQADLVVAVTHGRSGLSLALRGSFADLLIEEAPFDLLLRHAR